MKILIACEFSGRVREAFKARGFDAWSCDLLPTDIPGQHIQGDVLEVLDDGWDLMIAHPPCTYLSVAGAGWLNRRPERKELMRISCLFFEELLNAPIENICIENPTIYKEARRLIGSEPNQIIEPFFFGEPYKKRTCL